MQIVPTEEFTGPAPSRITVENSSLGFARTDFTEEKYPREVIAITERVTNGS